MKETSFFVAAVAFCSAIALVQCASNRAADAADPAAGIRGAEAFYVEAEQVRQQMQAAADANARMAVFDAYRASLRNRAAAYERTVTNGKVDRAEQKVYDELLGLLLTLNNFPNKTFSPDYCEIIQQSIYMAWAPNEVAPDPEKFPKPAREGLKFLDLFCATP